MNLAIDSQLNIAPINVEISILIWCDWGFYLDR